LIVEGKDQSMAIKCVLKETQRRDKRGELMGRADCDDCSFAMIRNLEVDGNRPQLLRIKKGDALVEMGNGEGQVVRNCRLYEPRCVRCVGVVESERMG
jgi:hypothetical protein